MSDFDVKNAWRERIRQEHSERAQRMINDHWKRMGDSDITQEKIEVILLDPLTEPATSREEWASIKAEAIMSTLKYLKGE